MVDFKRFTLKSNLMTFFYLLKYCLALMILCGIWSFIGGLLIGLGRSHGFGDTIGLLVIIVGLIGSMLLLDYLIKRKKLAWFKKANTSTQK